MRVHPEFEVQANDELPPIEADLEVCAKLNARFPGPESITPKDLTIADSWIIEDPELLSHINDIENPAVTGHSIQVQAVVSSTSVAYSVPSKIRARFRDGSEEEHVIQRNDPLNLELISIPSGMKRSRLENLFRRDQLAAITETEYRTIYRVRVRPPISTLERRGTSVIDEREKEYKAYDVHVVTDRDLTFQPATNVQLVGIPIPDPKNQRITVLVSKITFPDDTKGYDKAKVERLRSFLATKSIRERVDWTLESFRQYSNIVGRGNLAFAGLLGFFSTIWIETDQNTSNNQHGWTNILVIGDTTTAKSETVRKLISALNAGVLITAETASTVGLTGTATQTEREGWFVDWGFLPLNDRRLLAIDGAQKLSASQWASLAESERTGTVMITKAAKANAYARTRQIKLANPVDPENDRYSTKSISEFLHPVQSIRTILDKTSIARLDLAVFADMRDVKAESINKVNQKVDATDLELFSCFSEVIKWVWSGSAKIQFDQSTWKTLLEEATALYDAFFTDSIPLVSIDMKWKLARLSAALANLTISTEDLKVVTVTADHVTLISQFLRSEYTKAGLNVLAKSQRYEVLTIEEINETKVRLQNATQIDLPKINAILKYITEEGRITKAQIQSKFSLAEKNELRPLMAVLQTEGLIKQGSGYYATPKLIQLYKTETATIATIASPKRDPPSSFSNHTDEGGSSSNHGKQGKHGNIPPEILAKVGTWSYNHPAPGGEGWMVHADLRCLLSPIEYEILRRSDLLETKDDATLVRLKTQ